MLIEQILCDRWSMPAHDFERRSGAIGIAADYRFPNNLSPVEAISEYVRLCGLDQGDKSLSVLYNSQSVRSEALAYIYDVLALNPALKKVRCNFYSPHDAGHFMMGVASGFNADDIDFFINEWMLALDTLRRAQYKQYVDALNVKLGVKTYFIPSPPTVSKIKEQFGLHGWQPTRSELLCATGQIDQIIRRDLQPHNEPEQIR